MEAMSIKEAAKELHVEAHVLRYWEDELQLEIKRNSMGHRYYDERDIRMFREVQELKAKGFALKDIRMGIARQKKTAGGQKTLKELTPESEQQTSVREPEPESRQQTPAGKLKQEKQQELRQEKDGEKEVKQDGHVVSGDVKVVDFKLAQMQTAMNRIVANALRENKDIITSALKSEITTDVMRQFDTVMRERAEWEEERFRKLDMLLRQIQQSNAEAAATKEKKRFGRKKF